MALSTGIKKIPIELICFSFAPICWKKVAELFLFSPDYCICRYILAPFRQTLVKNKKNNNNYYLLPPLYVT